MHVGTPEDIRVVVLPLFRHLDMVIGGDNISCSSEQECHRHISSGITEDTRRMSDRDAAFSASLNMDMVIADTYYGNRFEIRRSRDHLWRNGFVSIRH